MLPSEEECLTLLEKPVIYYESFRSSFVGIFENHKTCSGNYFNEFGPDYTHYNKNGLAEYQMWHMEPAIGYNPRKDNFYILENVGQIRRGWIDDIKARMSEKQYRSFLIFLEKDHASLDVYPIEDSSNCRPLKDSK